MPKKEHNKYIDPDLPSIGIAIMSIVGGVASSITIYEWVNNRIKSRNRRKPTLILKDMKDTLLYLETDIVILQQIANSGGILNKKFRMGTRMYISKDEFKRYQEVTNKILDRLKKLVSLTNRLESALATEITYPRYDTRLEKIVPGLEGLIRDEDITINEALIELNRNIKLIRDEIERLRENQNE